MAKGSRLTDRIEGELRNAKEITYVSKRHHQREAAQVD